MLLSQCNTTVTNYIPNTLELPQSCANPSHVCVSSVMDQLDANIFPEAGGSGDAETKWPVSADALPTV